MRKFFWSMGIFWISLLAIRSLWAKNLPNSEKEWAKAINEEKILLESRAKDFWQRIEEAKQFRLQVDSHVTEYKANKAKEAQEQETVRCEQVKNRQPLFYPEDSSLYQTYLQEKVQEEQTYEQTRQKYVKFRSFRTQLIKDAEEIPADIELGLEPAQK